MSADKLAERIRTRLAEAFPELDAADPAFFDQAAHEAADEASAEIARRDRSIVELTRAGRGVLDQRNEALAEVERLTARIDATHRTLSSVDIDEESCSTLESTTEAVVSSWHRIAESEAAAADRIDALTRESDTLNRLFDVQQTRMREATELWRAEDPEGRALILPDLGDLLKWLMVRAEVPEPCPLDHSCDDADEDRGCQCWCELHDCAIAECPTFLRVETLYPELRAELKRLAEQATHWMEEAQRQAIARDANFVEAQRYREALETIGTECSNFTGESTCLTAGRARGARYLADAWCHACIAREALTAPVADEGSAR